MPYIKTHVPHGMSAPLTLATMSVPSSDTPDCNLFVTRIIFHSFLLVIFPVFTVYAFSFSNIFALLGLAIFIVIITLLAG